MEEPYEYIFNMIFNAIFANLAVPKQPANQPANQPGRLNPITAGRVVITLIFLPLFSHASTNLPPRCYIEPEPQAVD